MATGSDVKFRVSVDADEAKKNLGDLGNQFDNAADQARQLEGTGRGAATSIDRVGESARAAGDLVKNLGAQLAAAFAFNELVQAAAQMETVRAGLTAVTGSAEAAGKEFDFIRTVATRVGADIGQVGQSFLGLTAAVKGTAVEGEPTRQVFEAVATAMGKAGKSSAETQNALVALAQIASKGTVSMEELRGQLGEALPGALQAAASGLGVTTQDLIKLVEQGQIAAEDLFPALTKGLNELYGTSAGAQTLAQEITNIKNQFIELANNLGESGGLNVLKVGAELAQIALVNLDVSLVAIGKTIGTLIAAVANWDFSGLTQAFADIEAEARDKLLRAAQHNQTLANAIRLSGDEAAIAKLPMEGLAGAAQKGGEAAQTASGGYVALASAYTKVRTELEGQIEAAQKNAEAVEAEGKASVQLATLFGTEAEKRAAVAQAAADNTAALQRLAESRQTEVNVMQAELAAKEAELAQGGKISEQRQKELEELRQKIALKQDEAAKATAVAEASRLSAEAAKAESAAYADNSQRVAELRDAYIAAKESVDQLRAAKLAGKDVTDQLKNAEVEAGKAAIAYKDALKDQADAIKAKSESARAANDLEQASVRVAKEQWQAILEVAKARGDEVTAARAQNEIRKLEIELLRLKAQALRAEADAQIASAKAERARLEASGALTEADRLRIDAAIKKAEVLRKEADIADITARKMDDLSRANGSLANASRTAAGAIDGTTGALIRQNAAIEENIAAQEKANELKQRAIDLENKRRNVDSEGFSLNTAGQRVGMQIETQNSIFQRLKSGGMDAARADQLANELFQQYQQWSKGTASGIGTFSGATGAPDWLTKPFEQIINETIQKEQVAAAQQQAFQSAQKQQQTQQPRPTQQAPAPFQMPTQFAPMPAIAPTQAAAQAARPGGGDTFTSMSLGVTTPVNININGARRTIGVNPGDVGTLESLLRTVANDAFRSSSR